MVLYPVKSWRVHLGDIGRLSSSDTLRYAFDLLLLASVISNSIQNMMILNDEVSAYTTLIAETVGMI